MVLCVLVRAGAAPPQGGTHLHSARNLLLQLVRHAEPPAQLCGRLQVGARRQKGRLQRVCAPGAQAGEQRSGDLCNCAGPLSALPGAHQATQPHLLSLPLAAPLHCHEGHTSPVTVGQGCARRHIRRVGACCTIAFQPRRPVGQHGAVAPHFLHKWRLCRTSGRAAALVACTQALKQVRHVTRSASAHLQGHKKPWELRHVHL